MAQDVGRRDGEADPAETARDALGVVLQGEKGQHQERDRERRRVSRSKRVLSAPERDAAEYRRDETARQREGGARGQKAAGEAEFAASPVGGHEAAGRLPHVPE